MLTHKSYALGDGLANFRSNSRSALRTNRSNNSFATATDLGVYQGGSANYKFGGTLSKKDPVDFFKYKLRQGTTVVGGLDTLKVRSGKLRFTGFFDKGDGITRLTQFQYSKGSYRQSSQGYMVPYDVTFYLKYDRANFKGTTRYEAKSFFN